MTDPTPTPAQLATCPTVQRMTAGGAFDLDELTEHAATCPACRAILAAMRPLVQDAVTPWPAPPTGAGAPAQSQSG